MDLWEAVRGRRSIRAYRPEAVPQDKIAKVLEAARLAPSACNKQPWHFFAVTDPLKRADLKAAYGKEWFWKAPAVIVACARPQEAWVRFDKTSYAWVDVAIAFDHLTLAAHAEGLGTCWIGAFKPEEVRRVLSLPNDLEPVAMTPLGWPAAAGRPAQRKSLGEITTWV